MTLGRLSAGLLEISMKLYALFKDGELYRASYDQNTPFYMSIKGAEKALQSVTNIRNVPHNLEGVSITQKREYLEELKTHFTIIEFKLIKEGEINVKSRI